jgi:hypothetical protein
VPRSDRRGPPRGTALQPPWRHPATAGARRGRRPLLTPRCPCARAAASWPPRRTLGHPGAPAGPMPCLWPWWPACGRIAPPPPVRRVHTPRGTPLLRARVGAARGGCRTVCRDIAYNGPRIRARGRPGTPRSRTGGCRSRGWCATLPALIQRLRRSCPVEPQPSHPFVKECPL